VKRTTLILQVLCLPLFLLCFAGAALAGITLAWDANDDANVAGYKVYYQTNSATVPLVGNAAQEGPSPINVGDTLTFTLSGLDESQIHYFAVTAYDHKGVESTLSEMVASRWVPTARTPEQDTQVAPHRVTFQWTEPPSDTRIVGYRLYYSTDEGQLSTAVNSGLAQAIGGGALTASIALLGVGLGRSGMRRRNWLALAMLAVLIGTYGCGGGGGGSDGPSVQIPEAVETGDDTLTAVSVVTGLVDTYHSAFDLEPSTTYFWKVVAIDEHGQEFEGATYSFTTESL
jgi:hypothetical protein